MSLRLLKKVLQEQEGLQHRIHHHDGDEEEDHLSDSESIGTGNHRSSINPFDLLNDGDEDPGSEKEIETEIADESMIEKKNNEEAHHPPRNASTRPGAPSGQKSKKKKKKKSKEGAPDPAKTESTLDETLEALSLDVTSTDHKADAENCSKKASHSALQRAFQAAQAIHDLNGVASALIHHPYHLDSLITMADYFRFVGEHQMAADSIAKCLYALECAWHPTFTPFEGNCRLKYNHETNKPLFTALFTHMRSMDRRGCHRSALEVCKLLLSLDTDDPVGALFCVDYFALRAEEYAWLEQFTEEYKRETQTDTSESSSLDLMKQALMLHPTVLKKLVVKVPLKDQVWRKIFEHSYFRSDQTKIPSLDHLINIYVERSYLIWRLPDVQKLLRSAAELVIESLKQNRDEAKDWVCARKEAFPSEKNEYFHLSVQDYSDSTPTLPPDNLQNFVVDPRMVDPGIQMRDQAAERLEGGGQIPPPPREVVNRNLLVVLFESMLPWVHYEDGREVAGDPHNANHQPHEDDHDHGHGHGQGGVEH